jgi:hypothetical protein
MKDYLDDLLVWAIILAILVPVFIALFRRKQAFIFGLGLLIFLAALPATFMSEISINGCCGAASTGYEGVGYLIGGVMAVSGILLMTFSKKLAKK